MAMTAMHRLLVTLDGAHDPAANHEQPDSESGDYLIKWNLLGEDP